MTRLLGLLACAALVCVTAAAAQNVFPSRIDLPNGFRPEGIATQGTQFYVGSIPTGAVYRGNLRTGTGAVFVQPQAGRAAIGLKVDRKPDLRRRRPDGRRLRLRREDRRERRCVRLRVQRHLRQRRRRDEVGGLVHRLDEAGAVPRSARPRWPARRGFGVHDSAVVRRLPAPRRRVQPERHRRDAERKDAHRRAVGDGSAVHRHAEWRHAGDNARQPARACRTATGYCSKDARSTSRRTSSTASRRSRSRRI